jgi:hypothetical protein
MHVMRAGGFLSLALTNVAGQGAIKLVELRSSPSGVQYLMYSLHQFACTGSMTRCQQQAGICADKPS